MALILALVGPADGLVSRSRRVPVPTLALSILLMTGGCASLPNGFARPVSHTFIDTADTKLGKASRGYRLGRPGHSGFYPLETGLDALAALDALAESAQRSINAQYYFVRDDLVGRLFMERLLRAADRGVRVRVLVDAMELSRAERLLLIADMHPHLDVRVFNPFAPDMNRNFQIVTALNDTDRRMHNKSFTVDNQFAVLGGRNIGDEYFAANTDLSLLDLDVMAIGPVVGQISRAFDSFWNNELAYPISVLVTQPPATQEFEKTRADLKLFAAEQRNSSYLLEVRESSLARAFADNSIYFYWGEGEVVYDPPEKITAHDGDSVRYLTQQLNDRVAPIYSELLIASPYFIPGDSGVAAFRKMTQAGIRVRVLTNSLASDDVGVVYAGFLKYRTALLKAGVEVRELDNVLTIAERKRRNWIPGSSLAVMHAKFFVYDRQFAFIGSLNLDSRSIHFNTEIGVIAHSPALAEHLAKTFDDWAKHRAYRLQLVEDGDGYEKTHWYGFIGGKFTIYDQEPKASLWQRFVAALLSALPIDPLL
jgi:putative cardiolipin synthase